MKRMFSAKMSADGRAALSLAGNLVEKLIHDLLSEPKVCALHAFKSIREIQEMALRRPAQNT
jgi:hypothetical protein